MIDDFIDNKVVVLITRLVALVAFGKLIYGTYEFLRRNRRKSLGQFAQVTSVLIPAISSSALMYLTNFSIVCFTPVGEVARCEELKQFPEIVEGLLSFSLPFILPVSLSLVLLTRVVNNRYDLIPFLFRRNPWSLLAAYTPWRLGIGWYYAIWLLNVILVTLFLSAVVMLYPTSVGWPENADTLIPAICTIGSVFSLPFVLLLPLSLMILVAPKMYRP